ncbi:MAG TPA: dihydrolipoyl dehydrogenase [Amaricoccus sp.]|uniref:dihydrolipoyl dehydrogenase n=1 Tax=Amaricoccus sp. TaxID=1872485 RepID=UPI002CE40C24|nr:dihydrolipoyl dehydrogenase [Amaricoccus sp.]HMQ94361.1 dihydrolipoyl dehydrogenase [Amaricoccus sp.]HMR51345.1 dihydrolipoyl dehydrogenase [Amaricoccus sp.]HMR59593.1 dihydrolipoyl dehydrogenase [Amaricoccus sp.]HMT98211.1 dihydrolipoyl dehydrogenase [Amaricoccus sp.]
MATEIKVPDIGDFSDVPVISVFVKPGDTIAKEDPLVELESDKATMEVPSPAAGKVVEVKVKEGDRVSEGAVILTLEAEGAAAAPAPAEAPKAAPAAAPASRPSAAQTGDIHAELLVLGSGPGGYTAAFRAADLGLKVVLVERDPYLGGVCLNVGCIPSKALLHAAKVVTEAEEMAGHGVTFGKAKVDIDALRGWKESVVKKLTGGLGGLAKGRKVQVVTGKGTFAGPNLLNVETADGAKSVSFDQCIIAAGSEPVRLPFVPHDDPRVIDSTGALELADVPKRLLVIGGGIIGLEMACVYDALGSKVTVIELMDQIIPGADKDIVKPLHKRIEGRYEAIHLGAKVTGVEAMKSGLKVAMEGPKGAFSDTFDRVLVAVGRRPNGKLLGLEAAGVTVDERGFVPVDKQQRTNVGHIFAIGDVVGQPMLAHKAVHEGKVAAEVAAGENRVFDARVIPSVAYTDPEIAWVGLTETEAKAKGVKFGKGVFPWAASGRSLSLGRDEGITKLLFDEETERVIGAGIVGPNAGDLVAEVALAIEMGADATDIGQTIHPHPTLSETVNFAAEMFEGTITDLIPPKRKKA